MLLIRIVFVLLLGLFLSNCSNSKGNNFREKLFIALGIMAQEPVNLKGKAMKGVIANGVVKAVKLTSDGKCDRTGTALAQTMSNGSGDYSLSYIKTGSPICVVITPNPDGSSKMHNEKTDKWIDWKGANLYYETVLSEPAGMDKPEAGLGTSAASIQASENNVNITPISNSVARKIATSMKSSGGDASTTVTNVSKELSNKLGLSQASSLNVDISGLPAPDFNYQKSFKSMIQASMKIKAKSNEGVDITGTSEDAIKYKLRLYAIMQMIQSVAQTSNANVSEIDNTTNAIAEYLSGNSNVSYGQGKKKKNIGDLLNKVLPKSALDYVSSGGGKDLGLDLTNIGDKIITSDGDFPVFTPYPMSYATDVTVKLKSLKENTIIRYTDNTEDPSNQVVADPTCTSGNVYESPIKLSKDASVTKNYIVKAVSCVNGVAGKVNTAKYELFPIYYVSPSVSPDGGLVSVNTTVNINHSNSASLTTRYTTDLLLDLNCASGTVGTSLTVSRTTAVKTILCDGNGIESLPTVREFVVVTAPQGLKYPDSTLVLSAGGELEEMYPMVDGEDLTFSVSPALPAGMYLSEYGVLYGTPSAAQAADNYTITATNSAGSDSTKISIEVKNTSPTSLSYKYSNLNYTAGEIGVLNEPYVEGSGLKFSISPSLPVGLSMDENGIIGGIPTVATAQQIYTVTASNSLGSTSTSLTLGVLGPIAPSSPVYGASYTFNLYDYISPIVPTVDGSAYYTISGSLPDGLYFDEFTGEIYGIPTTTQASTSYTVTATNSYGVATSGTFTILVGDSAPTGLTYPSSVTLTQNTTTNLPINKTAVTGAVTEYYVTPDLPSGMYINPETGEISGVPSSYDVTGTTYTIYASNSKGDATANISIVIHPAPPSNLTYSSNSYVFDQNVPIASYSPTVSGYVPPTGGYSINPGIAANTGLTFDADTGAISGTPSIASGNVTYTITASNGYGASTSTTLDISVASAVVYVSGTISGYVGSSGLQISDGAGNSLSVSANSTTFQFGAIAQGTSYNVAVTSNPTSPWQTCTVFNPSGTIGSTIVNNVLITCNDDTFTIGGTVSGYTNGSSALQVTDGTSTASITADGSFTLATPRASMSGYTISVSSQPITPWQTCNVTSGGSGSITNANITNVVVSCTLNTYTVGGSVTGFSAGTDLVLSDGTNTVNVTAGSASFVFPARNSGSSYTVSVSTPPTAPAHTCTLASNTGTITNGNITNVAVSCVQTEFYIQGTVTNLTTTGLVLAYNTGATINQSIAANATGHTQLLTSGFAYSVYVATQPVGQVCSVVTSTPPSGTITANVTVDVNCVNGYLVGGRIQSSPQAPINQHLYQGNVTTFAGSGTLGSAEGNGGSAGFNGPRHLVFDGLNFYVVDQSNHKIRKITPAGDVTTFAGNGTAGNTDGIGTASFNNPFGITTDGTYLYVSEYGGHRIKRVLISTGYVETIAGDNSVVSPATGLINATGTAARFNYPSGMVLDGKSLYIADRYNNAIRVLDLTSRNVTTFASGLSEPIGITLVGNYLYVANRAGNTIVRINKSDASQIIFAGTNGVSGFVDGTGASAKLNQPSDIMTEGQFLYVAEYSNHGIRQIEISTQRVTTLAGTSTAGTSNGTGVNASFTSPIGIATDGKNLYMSNEHSIRKITNNGLVAYYPLNTSPMDYAGANIGTVNNGSTFTAADRFGTSNSAVTFNGSTQYISASDAGLPSGGSARTICAWIKPNSLPTTNNYSPIVGYGPLTTDSMNVLSLFNDAGVQKIVLMGFGGNTHNIEGNITLPTGLWSNICTTYNGSLGSIYANGKLIGIKSIAWNTILTGTLLVGNFSSYYFNGNIADVRIYGRVLNDGEINELAQNSTQAQVGASYSTGATGLLVNYKFKNGNLNDSGALGMTLTATGSPIVVAGNDGEGDGAYRFDGSTQYMSASSLLGLPTGNAPRSVCTWYNPERYPPPGNYEAITSYGTGSSNAVFGIGIKNFSPIIKLIIATWGTDFVFENTMIPLNTWSHICAIYDGANVNVSVNGKLNTQQAAASINTGNTAFKIASMVDNSANAKGKIDDVRVYNKALSSDAIRQLATQIPTGLVARYDFTGDANDVSGFGQNGTNNGASLDIDRFGNTNSSYTFDGSTNYIQATDTNLPSGGAARTVCSWMQLSSQPSATQYTMVSYGNEATLSYNDSSTIKSFVWKYNSSSSHSWLRGSSGVVPNVWNHVCATQDSSNIPRIYVNGALVTSGSGALSTTLTGSLFVGKNSTGSYFNGKIDDVLIYNRVLSIEEIRAMSGYHPWQVTTMDFATQANSSLALHYQADSYNLTDNASISAPWLDNSGNSADLTAYSAPAFRLGANGINGKPTVSFDGTSKYFEKTGHSIAYTNGVTVFAVAKNIASDSNYREIISKEPTTAVANSCRINFGKNLSPVNDYFLEVQDPSFNVNTNAAFGNSEIAIISGMNHAGGNLYLDKNGDMNPTTSSAGSTLNCSNSDPIRIGKRVDSAATNSEFTGLISEVIVFNRAINANSVYGVGWQDRQIVNCYLSSKYGIIIGHSCP